MSTALLFGAAFLQNRLTCYFYPHVIYFNPKICRWAVETNYWKLIPFYIATIIVIFILGLHLCLFQVFKYIFLPTSINGFLVGFMATLAVLSLIDWMLSIPSMFYGKYMVSYINALADFEEELILKLEKTRVPKKLFLSLSTVTLLNPDKTNQRAQLNWDYYTKCLIKEIRNIFQRKQCDYLGLCLNIVVIYASTFGWFVVPIGIYFRLEPFYYTLDDLGLITRLPTWLTIMIRTILSYVCVLETCRTFTIFCPVAQHSLIYHKCLDVLSNNLYLSKRAFLLYTQIQILHQSGDWMVKFYFAAYLGTGMYLCIIFNIFTLVGWKVFPLSLYLFCAPLTVLIYFLLLTIPPIWVKTHHMSLRIIKHLWPMRAVLGECKDIRFKEMKRYLRKLRPITFHSGNVATLDNETKCNYFGHIFDYTMSLLLLFESYVEKGSRLDHM